MDIKSIGSAALNLPVVCQISSLIGRSYNVIEKNKDAAEEAQTVAIIATAGTIFGLLGKGVLMVTAAQFSLPILLAYGLIGLAAGTAASSTVIYSFFSKMNKREEGNTVNDRGNPALLTRYLLQQRQLQGHNVRSDLA